MEKIIVKKANKNIIEELNSIKFDSSYIYNAAEKYSGELYKIFSLKPHEANILKQLCLSLGFDCAVSRDTITCSCNETDAIIFATKSQLNALTEKLKNQPFRLKQLSEIFLELKKMNLSTLKINNTVFNWEKPYIMGILNVTPDSFSDGGLYNSIDSAYEHCIEMIKDGADIIDIGGESTRPNSTLITTDEELKRVIPVIEKIRKNNINIPISIDTKNYTTAKVAIEAGADIINDVSGLDYDKKLFEYVTNKNIPTIIMHSNKVPAVSADFTMGDIVEQVYFSLYNKISALNEHGLEKNKIIADVGIGFGKSAESNFELLKRHDEFSTLGIPMLLGVSRKSFIRNTLNLSISEADIPTAYYSSITKNVQIHRVHNVKQTKKFLDYFSLIK